MFTRQWVYDLGGGPVWYARNDQYFAVPPDRRDWLVRTEAGAADWLHEREWRIRVPPGYSSFQVLPGSIGAILVEDPNWLPWRQVVVRTGYLIGMDGLPSMDGVADEVRLEWQLPRLWQGVPRIWWDRSTQRLVHLNRVWLS